MKVESLPFNLDAGRKQDLHQKALTPVQRRHLADCLEGRPTLDAGSVILQSRCETMNGKDREI